MSESPGSPRLDARLLPCAGAAWAVTLLGLYTGGRTVAVVAAAAAVAALVITGRGRPRRHTVARVVLAVLTVVAGFGAAAAIRMWFVEHHPLAAAAADGGWATVAITPTDDPRPLRRDAFDGTPQVRIPARLHHVTVAGRSIATGGSVVVFAPADSWGDLLPGQRIGARVRLAAPSGPGTTVAMLRADGPPRVVAPPPIWQRWAGVVRDRLADACRGALPPAPAGLLPGLVVGDTSALTDEVREDFRVAGLAHLTAVSGANISILLGAVLLAVRAAGLGPRTATVLAATVLVAFVIVVRPSASVVRAATMGSIALLALVAGRERQALPALCAAVGILLVPAPELAVDVGFALSVSATAALIVVAPVLAARLQERRWPRPVAEATAMSVAAFAITAPLVAAVNGTVSVVSVAANLLVVPVLAPLTVLGSAVAVAATCVPAAGELLARAAAPLLWWLLTVARGAAGLPSAELTVPSGPAGAAVVVVLLVVGALVVRFRPVRAVAAVIVVAVAVVWIPVRVLQPNWPGAGWVFVVCDVGQGDALVLSAGGGSAVVIDTGPEPVAVDRCLRRLGIHTVPLLVLSHLHADHTDGISGVLAHREVHTVVVGAGATTREGGDELLRAVAGLNVREVGAGDVLRAGTSEIRVLGPTRPAPGLQENDLSLVLLAETPIGRVLLPGDAEEAALDAVLRTGTDVRADVLKIPHHGSRTTPERFLAAVRPRVAVAGVGRDNRFGHPHPDIVAALRGLGARVWSTDLHGDVAVVWAGSGALAVVSGSRGTIEP